MDEVPLHRGTSLMSNSPPPRTLQEACAWGLIVILGGGAFLVSEVSLYDNKSVNLLYLFEWAPESGS